jgi:hypothetical protein
MKPDIGNLYYHILTTFNTLAILPRGQASTILLECWREVEEFRTDGVLWEA